MTTQYGSKMML